MSDIADPRYEDPAFIAPGFGGTWLAAGEEGSVLPRTPSGHINNCAIANGEPEDECQMCGGTCPDRDRLLHHSRTQIGYRDTALRSLEQDKQAAIERAKPKAADLGSWAEQGPTEQPKSEQDKQRGADLYALGKVLEQDVLADVDEFSRGLLSSHISEDEEEAFSDMRERLQRGRYPLTEKQRGWLHKVCARVGIDPDPRTPEERNRNVPRGREVATPKSLQELPKAPPRRRGQ